jgi:hypothetical protein
MSQLDDLWDELVDQSILDPDQMGRARTRFFELGGGIGTAVMETVALDDVGRHRLIAVTAETLGHQVAPIEWLDAPDLSAMAQIPRPLLMDYGVLPVRTPNGILTLVTPAHAPHVLEKIRQEIELEFQEIYIALEVDLRDALQRFADLEPSTRFHALWTGDCPSALRSGEHGNWCSLESAVIGNPVPANSSAYPSRTNPGRPRALGMADTDELQPDLIADHWQKDQTAAGAPTAAMTPLSPLDTLPPQSAIPGADEPSPSREEPATSPP